MANLKDCDDKDRIIKNSIKIVEQYLMVNNGHWNNQLKLYQFEFGERLEIETIYLSEKSVLHIANLS